MDRYETFIREQASPRWKPGQVAIAGLIAAFLAWTSLARLDQFAVATGEVIPQGKVKVIQHLEGGIIAGIEVSEGDVVKAGAPLVLLDLATSGMNREEMRARLDELLLSRARLKAEAGGAPLRLPQDIAGRRPELAASETQVFTAKQAEIGGALQVLDLQIDQREKEIDELDAKLAAARRDLSLAREELTMKEVMLKEDLTSKLVVLKARQEVTRLQGELEVTEQKLPRVRQALSEYQARREETLSKFHREASEGLVEADQEIGRLKERLTMAEDQQHRALIKSPIDGVVKNIKYTTIGGVVRAGEPIMEIVPSQEALEIQARLAPSDRGYVHVGQTAKVKVSAYDFVRYGSLDGTVVTIAADTDVDQQAGAYYRAIVRTAKSYLGDRPGEYQIRPGMQAVVDIRVGTQTVLDYLLRPVLKLRHEAFREP